MKNKLIRFIRKIVFPHTYSSDVFTEYLKSKGVEVGKGTIFYSPNKTTIDLERPHLLHLGEYCKITEGVTILTHDYSRSVLLQMPEYGNVGEGGRTYIGDNVFIGMNAMILMGSKIGNNCIVGACSVVSGSFPDNVVIAGNPAKIICTIDEFYQKRKRKEIAAAKEFVAEFRSRNGRDPSIYEMTNSFAWLYLSGSKDLEQYADLLKSNGVDYAVYRESFLRHKPEYSSFEAFLKDCGE